MATEADIPEPASLMERGGVYRHLNLGEFDHPPETVDYLVKSGHMEVSSIAEAKAINSIFEANGGVTEGVSFFESPPIAKVPEEETRETQETCQAEKQIKKDENFKAAEETVSKEGEVSPETEEIAEKEERSHEISDTTRISLKEDSHHKIDEEKNSREEKIVDHIEPNNQVLIEKSPTSIDKETLVSDSQKEEEGEKKEEEDVEHKTNKEAGILEAKTNKEAGILEASSDLHTSESLDTNAETHTNPSLDNEDNGPDLAQPIEKIESEKEGIRHVEVEEASSTVAASLDSQNDEEASSEIIENVEEKLDIPSVTFARDKSREDKVEEKFDIASKVESQDINNSNENDMTPLLDKTEEKSHVEIPEPESSGAVKVKHVMNTGKTLDSLVTKHEQGMQNVDPVSESLSEDRRDESGNTVVADEDSIVDAVTAPEHSENEPENEKLQTSLEMDAEKIDRTASRDLSETIICAKEDTSIGNQEESYDKKEKEEKSVDIEAVRIDRIPKEEDLPPTALHDETEITEADIPKKNEDELNAIHSLQKEKVLVEGEKLARDEEEFHDNDSQACESTMKPSLELPSEKGTVTTEPSSETSEVEIETSKAVLVDTEEISETADAEKCMKDNIKVEACESEMQNLPTSDNTEKSHAEEATSHKVGSSAFLHEIIEQNVQAASVQEVATPLKDEVEDNDKATSIINEEVTGNGEADDELNIRHNVVHLPSEIIIQERVESSQLTEKEVDVSKGEDSEGVSQESVEEGTFKNTQDDEKDTEKSRSREIFEKSETAETIDSIENEAKHSDENPGSTLQCSLGKEQESQQSQNLTVQQASLAEEIDEYAAMNVEENVQKKEEACDCETERDKLVTSDKTGKCHPEEVTSDKSYHTAFTETVEQNFQPASLHEASPTLKDEVGFNEDTKSIISEEITGAGEVTDEQNKTNNVTHLSSEVVNEDTDKSTEHYEKEADIYKGEDIKGKIIGGNNASGISQESVGEKPINIPQNDENNTENSSDRKIFEKSDTAEPVDCTATEAKDSDESPNLVKELESQQSQNLTVVEASSIEKIEEDGSSIRKDEDRENDSELPEVEEHSEEILKGEEDLEQTSKKNETKENIEHPLHVVSSETEASSSSRTDDNTVEEVVEGPECDEREAETEKEEEFVNESNIRILSQDPVKNFSNDNVNAEQSNTEIFEKSEIDETVYGILAEAKESHQSPDIVKDQGNQQIQNLTILEASSMEKTGENRSSIKKDEDREDDSGLAKVEENNVISTETQVGVLRQTDHNVVGEGVESPQCNEREVEIAKDEEARNESNIESLSKESTAQDPVKNFLTDNNKAEKPNTEIFEKSETAETVDGIVVKEKQTDDSPELVKEQEILQSENLSICEASLVEKIVDDGTSIKNNESRKNETPPSVVEEHIEVILKDKDGIKQIFQQNEHKENIEHPLNVISAESETSASSQTDGTAVEDDGERPHCNERELEMEKVENVINEIAEDPVQSFHIDDIDAEKSNTNIFEKSETAETVDSIVTEVIQNDESNGIVKEHESQQSQKATTLEASSIRKIDEDGSSIEKDNFKLAEIEHNEVTLKGEEDLEETLQKNENEPKENIEPFKVISAETQAGTTSQPDDNTVEEEVEKPHCKETEVEMEKDEDIINESNVNSISQVSVADDPVKNFQNDDNSAESSNTEVKIERIENNENLNSPLQASLIGEQESMQSDNQTSPEASTVEEKDESGCSPKPNEEDENNTESEEIKVLGEKQTLKGKEDLEQGLQKTEPGKNLEQSITMPSAETEAGTLSEVTNNPVEEMYESPQCNSNEAWMPKGEDDTQEEITNKQNFDSLREESVEQVTVKNFQNEETNTEVSNKEIFESVTAKTSESIAVEMNQNNESPNASHPVVLIKEEETPQDKNIGSAEAFPNEKKEDDGSLFNERETKLVEAVENSKKETSHGEDNIVPELQNKEPGELLKSSRDVIAAETKADTLIEKVDDIIFPKEVGAVQNTEENLEVDLQKNEPGELLESSTDVITTETKGSTQSGKDSDGAISDEGTAIQNTEETADSEKKEDRNEDIDGSKVEKISTNEDLKPAAETCDLSTSVENESGEERLMTSEMEVETTDEIHGVDSVNKLEGTEMSKNKKEGMTKDDIGEVERDTTIAGLSEDTEKHIIMEAETTTDISTQSSKEEPNLIYEDKAEEKEPITVDEKEIMLDSVVTTAPRDDTLNLVEKRDREIPAEACEDKEDTKHEIQNKALIAGNGDQEEIIIEEMPSDNNLIEHSVMSAKDTTVSESQFVDTGIENTNEQAASYQSEDLNQELDNEQNISKPEYAEISKIEETGDLVGQQESCKSKISEYVEASNVGDEALKSTDSINADRKNAVLEEEDSGKKTEASLKEDDAVEKAAIQLEAEAGKQEAQTTEIKSYAFPTEESFEASESRKELDNTSEFMTRDQSVDPKEVEKTSISESVEQSSPESQESQQKIEEKAEPKFEAEDHIKQTKNAEETIEAAILTEKVQKEIEKADGGDLVNLFNKGENDLMKINTVSTGDERIDEVTESSSTSTEYVKATDTNGKTEIASSEVQETETIGNETSNTKEKEEIDADEVVKKTLGFSAIAPNKNSEEVIKEQIREEIDDCYDKEEVTMDSNLEIQTDGKPVEASNFPSDDSNLRAIEAEASQQDSMELEENSSNLASQLPTDDHENIKQENVATSSADVDTIVESTKTSVVYESKFNDMEELRTGEIKDENEEAAKSLGDQTVARSEVAIDQTLPKEVTKENEPASLAITCKEEEYETKVTTENLEESTEKVSITRDDSPGNSSAMEITEEMYLQNEKPRELEGKKGIPDSPNEEYEEKGEALNEIKEEIREASETVSGSKCHDLEVATGDEVTDDEALQEEKSEEQSQTESCALPSKEQKLGSATKVEKSEESLKGEELLKDESKTSEEVNLQKEEFREAQVSELELDSPNEAEKEARVASVEIEDKKDASQSIPQSNSEGKPKEDEFCSVQANPVEKPQDQNQTPSSMPLSSEQEEETSATAESIEEKITEMEALEDKSKEMEEPRELEISLLQLQHDKNTQQERQKEIYEREDEGENGTKEEMKEVSELVPESSCEETTAVAEDEFTSYHPLPIKKSEEQSQTSSAELLSEVQDHGISTAAASIEEKTIGVVMPEDAQNLTEEASLKEESRDLRPSQLEPRLDNNVQKKSSEEVHEAEVAISDETSKLQQPELENEKREAATESMPAEFTKEQIKEEKEDANARNCHAIILDEAAAKESHQENKLNDEESLVGDKMIAKDAAKEGDLGVTTSQKESITSLVEDSDANSGIHREEEKTCDVNSENQKSRESDSETMISTIKKEVPEMVQETMQVTEVGASAKNVDSEVNRHDGKATEETRSAKFSLFDMMQRSTREKQVAKELTREETSKEERQTEETEKAVKSDEEEEEQEEGEDGQKKNDSSGSDAPVMVEASRDIDIKVAAAHKKSHNILSGVGSKVKHSIIKVKKAITGKSSHQKQHSPKSSTT